MKKLKLKVEDLSVTSFAAEQETSGRRTIFGMATIGFTLCCGGTGDPPSEHTRCLCTGDPGCYPSLYCSGAGPGEPNQTCYEGCMTNENGAC